MLRILSAFVLLFFTLISPMAIADTPLECYNKNVLKYNNMYPRFVRIANAEMYCVLYQDMACVDLLLRTCSPHLQNSYRLLTSTSDKLTEAVTANQQHWTEFAASNSENRYLPASIIALVNAAAVVVSNLTSHYVGNEKDLMQSRLIQTNNDFVEALLNLAEYMLNESESQWTE